jgi:hypothetical protein
VRQTKPEVWQCNFPDFERDNSLEGVLVSLNVSLGILIVCCRALREVRVGCARAVHVLLPHDRLTSARDGVGQHRRNPRAVLLDKLLLSLRFCVKSSELLLTLYACLVIHSPP